MFRFIKWAILFVVWPLVTIAQLQISHPMPRLVIQRATDGNGRLYLSGRFTGAIDRVEAQLTPVAAGQGVATAWQTVQTNPTNNLFLGYVTGAGGWYVLTVRTLVGSTVIEQATVQPVGIGEVFITAGQSNARGLGIGDNDLGTNTDRVNAIDSINHYYPPDGQALLSSGDPSPVPIFKALTATRRVFPMAESSWGWGELGDYIVNRYNVPVAFFVAGWDGSTIDNWNKTANGIPTCNAYYCVANWPNLQPYTNLKNILQYYGAIAGVRAILWHQGEAEGDVASGDIPQYAARIKEVIQKSRQDFGGRNVPWIVARASFNGTKTTPDVVTQQESVIAMAGLNVFQGPLNDTIRNRAAGDTNVHFRNVSRPSIHPQYYLNNKAIPTNMGLSRFARNWNNSLNNAFFQNAQPITPTQFAATGNLAAYIGPGATVSVSFVTLGTFDASNQWQVQLLDSLGQYKSVLGSGSTSPIQVTLPSALQSGHFQIRVVATSPAMPAVPSNLFQIKNQADVSLAMSISQRTPDLNTPVTISLLIHNDGPGPTKSIIVRNRLPSNLAFVSSTDLSVTGTVLTSAAIDLNAGASQIVSFVAQPTALGSYQNAAEISQSLTSDPDSQPNSGTGDGQDDAAQLDFRTRQLSPSVFTSPNPNQVPLPGVSSNQPTPDPAKADVSLSLSVDNRAPRLGDIITYTITLTNLGGLAATGLSVAAYLPAGQTFVPGDDFGLSGGNPVGVVSSLAAGSYVSLRFRTSATTTGQGACAVQLTTSSIPDPDSTPGNGTTNGEDDTAQVDVRVR
ncbi:sialate O-acetylesterase [Spirosoma flavum]|uniref:Sialate O-acetylesterase n=1 Tax=Spirosoma flavum TaxID=2048557 RepID=A0ABW6ACC6_9BACT